MSCRNRFAFGVVLLVGASCNSSPTIEGQSVELASLAFEVPVGWQRQDTKQRGVTTSMWVPEDNTSKESITVIRTDHASAIANGGYGGLEKTLRRAQAALPDARISASRSLTTSRGLAGARIEVDYVPPGLTERYQRVHVVLVDGSTLVHVLYTTKSATAQQAALGLVLDTIRHEEA
ncbi:MAG: hypothetical protein AB7O24_10100 [Kofleriaceae bacterium]